VRPNISHVVNSVIQFLHAPTTNHFQVVKCILRYVKGTFYFNISFQRSTTSTTLTVYFDADWAGCPNTRRSTFGYSIFLGDNLVS